MNDSQKWFIFACLVGGGLLLYWLSPILFPFLVAALLAYLGDPLVDRLERKMPRTLAVTIVFVCLLLVMAALLVVLLPALQQQVVALIKGLPRYIDWLQANAIPWLNQNLGLDISLMNLETLKTAAKGHWQQVGGIAANVMNVISQSGMVMLAWLANLVLIPVVTFYLLRDWDELVAAVHDLLPRHLEPMVTQLSKESDEVLGAFVRGQLMVMLALGTIYALGLWMVGLDLALLIGMIAGLVSFVPYLGFILGFILAAVAALFQFQDAIQLLPVLAVFGVGQALEGMLLTPLLVGDKIGLHPVAVIFAVMAGGQLFGFVGILLALPVAAVIMVLLRHVHKQYRQSGLYTKANDPEVP
jgi:predicted PurR-regulated permease PerM